MSGNAEVAVRRASAADLDLVMEIDRGTAFVSHWSKAVYEKYAAEPREQFFHRCLLVAVCGGRLIGFVAGSFLEGNDAAMLENLAVDVEWRRRGVARALCGALVDWAKTEGAWDVDLEVRVSNDAAQALYESMQFVETGRRKKYYSGPEVDAVMMRLKLQ